LSKSQRDLDTLKLSGMDLMISQYLIYYSKEDIIIGAKILVTTTTSLRKHTTIAPQRWIGILALKIH
jgi:hypothetical protein